MQSASRKVRPGTSALMKPALMNQAIVMIGKSRKKSELRACQRYALGSSICEVRAMASSAPHASDEDLDTDDDAVQLVRKVVPALEIPVRPSQRIDPSPPLRPDRDAEQQSDDRAGHEEPLLEDVAKDADHADAAPSDASSMGSRTRNRARSTRSRPARRPRVARASQRAIAGRGRRREDAGARIACGPLC